MILAKGWKGFFENQNLNIVEGVVNNPEYWSQACVNMGKQFSSVHKSGLTHESYLKGEVVYAKFASECVLEEN